MYFFLIIFGIGLLWVTWKDYENSEADTTQILDWISSLFESFFVFEFKRSENPIIFWVIIVFQILLSIGSIIFGLTLWGLDTALSG